MASLTAQLFDDSFNFFQTGLFVKKNRTFLYDCSFYFHGFEFTGGKSPPPSKVCEFFELDTQNEAGDPEIDQDAKDIVARSDKGPGGNGGINTALV